MLKSKTFTANIVHDKLGQDILYVYSENSESIIVIFLFRGTSRGNWKSMCKNLLSINVVLLVFTSTVLYVE